MSLRPANPSAWVPPPLLLGAALLLWGWVWGPMWLAVPVALLVEGRRWVEQRWDFREVDYVRIWNVCMIFTLGMLTYNLFEAGLDETFYLAMQWLPILFLPLVLAQLYGEMGPIPLNTVAVLARRRRRMEEAAGRDLRPVRRMHLGYPFLALLALSLGGRFFTGPGPLNYSAVLVGLVSYALWANRDRGRGRPLLTLLAVVGALGLAGGSRAGIQWAARSMQGSLRGPQLRQQPPNQLWSQTAIGQIGDLKLSDRIRWTLEAPRRAAPDYLREASFLRYKNRNWMNQNHRLFHPVTNGPPWRVGEVTPSHEFTLRGRPGGPIVVLPMAFRTDLVSDLQAEGLRTNELACFQGNSMPGVVEYRVGHRPGPPEDPPPVEEDLSLELTDEEATIFSLLAGQLWKPSDGAEARLRAVERHFASGYRYTTYQDDRHGPSRHRRHALAHFLTTDREGHCEYFATATTLLLRRAGVPARYCVGFSVQEWDRRRGQFLLRGKHRHAWCQAWIDGAWRVVDTTPGDWRDIDMAGGNTLWRAVKDRFDRVTMAISLWRNSPAGQRVITVFVWSSGALLILYLVLRMLIGKRRRKRGRNPARVWPGQDSEFLPVLAALDGRSEPDAPEWREAYERGARLHARYRFDPQGLDAEERARLQADAATCLDGLQ